MSHIPLPEEKATPLTPPVYADDDVVLSQSRRRSTIGEAVLIASVGIPGPPLAEAPNMEDIIISSRSPARHANFAPREEGPMIRDPALSPSVNIELIPVASELDPNELGSPPLARDIYEDGRLSWCYCWNKADSMKWKRKYPVAAEVCRITGSFLTPAWCIPVTALQIVQSSLNSQLSPERHLINIVEQFFCMMLD